MPGFNLLKSQKINKSETNFILKKELGLELGLISESKRGLNLK